MSKKSKLGLFISVGAITVLMLFGFMQEDSHSTESVVDSLWDKYSIQSTQFDGEDSMLSITVYDEDDIDQVENYLQSNLSEEDSDHYNLNVYQWSSDASEFRKNAQENTSSNNEQ